MAHTATTAAMFSIAFGTLVILGGPGCSQTSNPPDEETDETLDARSDLPTPDAGCDPDAEQPPRERHLDDLRAARRGSLRVPSPTICSLVKQEVDRLGGVYLVEDIVQRPYEHPGKTFVRLEQLDGWGDNPLGDTTVTFHFGLSPCGRVHGSRQYHAELRDGAKVVVLFTKLEEGGYTIHMDAIFEKTESGYTNETLRYRDLEPRPLPRLKSDILEAYRRVRSGKSCPYEQEQSKTDTGASAGDAGIPAD